MTTSGELVVFSQIAHVLETMLEKENGVGRLALPFARRSTRLFKEGDFDGGYESFSAMKSIYMMALKEPEYAQDVYDYLVEEGVLEREAEDMNGKDLEPYEHVQENFTRKGDKEKEDIEEIKNCQYEQELDREHKIENDRELDRNSECANIEEHRNHVGREVIITEMYEIKEISETMSTPKDMPSSTTNTSSKTTKRKSNINKNLVINNIVLDIKTERCMDQPG